MTEQVVPDFPLLCIAQNGFLNSVSNALELETCGQSAIDSGYFIGMTLVDAQGREYRVESVQKVGNVGPFWGWRLLSSRRIRVQVRTTVVGTPSLSELKARVIQAIDKLTHQWDAVGDPEDVKRRVQQAHSTPELIEMFKGQA